MSKRSDLVAFVGKYTDLIDTKTLERLADNLDVDVVPEDFGGVL